MLDSRGKRQFRLQLDALQRASCYRRHRQRPQRRRDPAGAAVKGRDAVSVERVNNGGALARSFRKNFDRALVSFRAVTNAGSRGDKAAETVHPLGAPNRLEVLIKNLIRGRSARRLHDDVIGFLRHVVQRRRVGCQLRVIAAAVAGVAGDHLPSAKMILVDRSHHQDHPARNLLSHTGIKGVVFPFAVVGGVAIFARHAQGRRENTHRAHEFVNRNTLQHLHVFEDFFGQRRFR